MTAELIPVLNNDTQSILFMCFFHDYDYDTVNNYNTLMNNITIQFSHNSATNGGDIIYGAGLKYCSTPGISILHLSPNKISSNPLRVCTYDTGLPQCNRS